MNIRGSLLLIDLLDRFKSSDEDFTGLCNFIESSYDKDGYDKVYLSWVVSTYSPYRLFLDGLLDIDSDIYKSYLDRSSDYPHRLYHFNLGDKDNRIEYLEFLISLCKEGKI